MLPTEANRIAEQVATTATVEAPVERTRKTQAAKVAAILIIRFCRNLL